MVCIVCGYPDYLERAHVKDDSEFASHEDDTTRNIVKLCRNHHPMFDDGKIGLCREHNRLVMEIEGDILPVEPKTSIQNIRQKYVDWHNDRCDIAIRASLGLIPGQEYAAVCDKDWVVKFELNHY